MTYEQKLNNILSVNNKLIKLSCCKHDNNKAKIEDTKRSLKVEIQTALSLRNNK